MATDTGIASGAIANCTDGADEVPIVKWEAQARSFNGVSSVVATAMNKNFVIAPTYTDNTISLCMDMGADIHVSYINMSFLATNAVAQSGVGALVDYRESNGTHHYRTITGFKNSSNVAFKVNEEQNGYFSNTYSNISFRYIYIYYVKIGYGKIQSDCLSNWQVELGQVRTDYVPKVSASQTATLGRTVYGAKLNLTSGTGTENMVRVKISDLTWTYYTGGTNPIYYAQNVSNLKMYSRGELPNIRIQGFNDPVFAQTRSYQSKNMADLDCSVFEDTSTICFRCTAYTSRDDMLAAIGDNYIIYETTQTTDFTFDPISKPETYLGVNNFWIDCGDSSVEYYKSGYGYTSVTLNLGTGKNQMPDNVTWTMGTRDDSGNHVASNTSHYSSPIPVVPNSNYAFQGMYPDGVNTAWRIYRLDANKNWVSRSSAVTANKYVAGSGANIYYIQLECSSTIGATDIQVEKNGRCSDFEPYSATSVTAKLHKLVYLANVDVIRGIGSVTWNKVVYTGADDEAWGQNINSGVYRYYIKNNDVKRPTSGRGVVYSSRGTYASSGNAVGTIFSSASSATSVVIYYVPPQTCTTVAEFKTWLQSNNLDVTYEKATPESFTFPPVSFDTIEGEQYLFASEGNSALTYRKAVE